MFNFIYNTIKNPSERLEAFLMPHQASQISKQELERHRREAEKLRCDLNGEVIVPQTQDGFKLDALFFQGFDPISRQQTPKSGPTVVLFCGFAAHHYQFRDLIEKYRKQNCNVVIFNYRGVDNSEGKPTAQGLVLDGVAVVDYLYHHHRVPSTHILVHGTSFGGGASSAVADFRPGIAVVNHCSYSKLSKAAPHFITHSMPHLSIIKSLAPSVIRKINWDFDTESNWMKIRGKKCIVYHPDDEVIAKEASLFQAIHDKGTDTHIIKLETVPGYPPHGTPLEDRHITSILNHVLPSHISPLTTASNSNKSSSNPKPLDPSRVTYGKKLVGELWKNSLLFRVFSIVTCGALPLIALIFGSLFRKQIHT